MAAPPGVGAAFGVAAAALGAVVLYRYVDVGALGPLPNMYEPSWALPGKALSAWAEAVVVVAAAVGFGVSGRPAGGRPGRRGGRPAYRRRRDPPAPGRR